MKKLLMPLAGAALLGVSVQFAFAQAELDADGDGMLTYAELLTGYPDITEDDFAKMDANQDGMLDADEVAAAVEAGLLPAKDG